MFFGSIPVTEAAGAVLAHSLRFAGGTFKKGRVLSPDDVEALQGAGIAEVVAARLEEGDVPEDAAAGEIAAAARGDGARANAPFTGRCNLYAETAGIALIDRARIDALNHVVEAVTVATVAPNDLVEPGQMLATVKIIPFAVSRDALARCVSIAREGGPLVGVAPLTAHAAGLVMTALPGTKDSVLDKTAKVVRERLERLGSSLKAEVRCAHEQAAVTAAIDDLNRQGCDPILIYGASAIVDRRDVVPAGIVGAGGTIDHFGMPVDPGNLILTGHLGATAVVGLPGCARSPAMNGVDWVLWRLLSGAAVGPAAIQSMGVGGLLKETPSRPQARDLEPAAAAPRIPRIAALVLAAGQSRRMGAKNKLLEAVGGKPMVRHAVENALASQAGPVVVVVGHEAVRVREALAGCDVTVVANPHFADGLSTSLRAGIAAVPETCDGAIVLLGDMPAIGTRQIDRLIAAFNPVEGRAICVPTLRGKRGNPVLWARAYFEAMRDLKGDVGARHLIGANADAVCEVAVDDDAIFLDLDTPDALAAYRARAES